MKMVKLKNFIEIISLEIIILAMVNINYSSTQVINSTEEIIMQALVNAERPFYYDELNSFFSRQIGKKYYLNYISNNVNQSDHDRQSIGYKRDKCEAIIEKIIELIIKFLYKPTSVNEEKLKWLLRYIDSYGKVPAGLLNGNTDWIGSYRECVELNVTLDELKTDEYSFRGRYCMVNWYSPKINITRQYPLLRNGICVPDACSDKQLNESLQFVHFLLEHIPIIKNYLNNSYLQIQSIKCLVDVHLESDGTAFLIVCLIIFMIIFVSTIVDIIYQSQQIKINEISRSNSISIRHSHRKRCEQDNLNPNLNLNIDNADGGEDDNVNDDEIKTDSIISNINNENDNDESNLLNENLSSQNLSININTNNNSNSDGEKRKFLQTFVYYLICFSLYSNLKKLFCGRKLLTITNSLNCLHGIRVLSMIWIIFAHTYLFSLPTINDPLNIVKDIDNVPSYLLFDASFAVDTFFLLSGFLVYYGYYLKETQKIKLRWIKFLIQRYLRLTPLYAFILWFNASVAHTVGTGPFWDYGDNQYSQRQVCKKYWWTNLIYINNFYDMQDNCAPWSWFLANLMQFFLITPILLLLLKHYETIGIIAISTLAVASWISTGIVSYLNDYPIVFGGEINAYKLVANLDSMKDYLNSIYFRPYYRIGPYLIGILGAFIARKYFEKNMKMRIFHKFFASLTFSIIGATVLYGAYHRDLTNMEAAFYNSLTRSVWSICVFWLIFICINNECRLLNKFLSLRIWLPLSRLTYCVYLLHPILIAAYYDNLKEQLQFSHVNYLIFSAAFIVCAYFCSIIVTLFFELPFIEIEKRLFHQKM